MAKLTVHNAEITTAAVEVKTLTISGKQVTLAVFRQLREEPLIAENGTLNGEPWGTVNYHPDKCGNGYEHWHVVWQHGPELLRSRVDATPKFDRENEWFSPDSGCVFYTACVRAALRGDAPGYFKGNPIRREQIDYTNRFKTFEWRSVCQHGIQSALSMSEDAFAAVRITDELPGLRARAGREQEIWPNETDGVTNDRRALSREESKLDELMRRLDEQYPEGKSIDDLFRAYDADMQAEAVRRQHHRDLRRVIADLPQLFIAV